MTAARRGADLGGLLADWSGSQPACAVSPWHAARLIDVIAQPIQEN